MYESFFQLTERPFPATPVSQLYFPGDTVEQARQQFERCIERAEGIGMVVGGPGTGKTMLLHRLARQFKSKFHVALLAGASLCTRRSLLQNILFELKLPYRGLEEGELRLSLADFLQPSRECPLGMLLLVDEAHTLPLRLLEEIRLLTNLTADGEPRVRTVLAGSLVLEERFSNPKLASLNQRVAARCYLRPLTGAETPRYVRQMLSLGGAKQPIFTDDALRAIHFATDGVPRLINQLCDHALILAATGRQTKIDASGVQEAWSDLQQLPAPWSEPSSSVVEFGALTEMDETSLDASDSEESDEPTSPMLSERVVDDLAPVVEELPPPAPKLDPAQLFGAEFEEEEVVVDRFSPLPLETMDALEPTAIDSPAANVSGAQHDVDPALDAEPTSDVERTVSVAPYLKLANIPDLTDEEPLVTAPTVNLEEEDASSLVVATTELQIAAFADDQAPISLELDPEFEPADAIDFDPVYPEPTPSLDRHDPIVVASANPWPVNDDTLTGDIALVAPIRRQRPEFQQLFANLRGAP